MQAEPDNKVGFTRYLRTALASLYDPAALRHSPLVGLFGVDQRDDPVSALRRILTDAIESLRPNKNTPLGSRTWRIYQILRRRYTEQLIQCKVASDLGLSIRQLQREEKLAREMLANHLWTVHNLETRWRTLNKSQPALAEEHTSPAEESIPTRTQELEWLRDSVPVQMSDVRQVIRDVLKTIGPLLAASSVSVEYAASENSPYIRLQAPILRQALLNVVSTAICAVPGGQIRVLADVFPRQVCVRVHATAPQNAAVAAQPQEYAESLELAEQLVHLAGGTLEITPTGGEVFAAALALPAAEQMTVLVIDDNADALQLFQRYLSGSHYHFVGAQDAQRGLALATELAPQIIVLDVMMPEQDGWTLLGQLREHPTTRGVPIIVCTILPQEQLALTLGAAEFIRKPVSRKTLLSALDRQADQLLKESRQLP